MKILTLNLWFSEYLQKERTIIFLNYIFDKSPDIICIQEVIAPVLSYLFKSLETIYPHIHTSVENQGYGLAILSKEPIHDRKNMFFKYSNMNRGVIYGKINNIIIATTHLESEFNKNNPYKIDQFNSLIKLLSKYQKVILVGDTNLTKNDESKINVDKFYDVYLNFDNSVNKLYTYDGKENPLLNNKIRSRVDRIYAKGDINFESFNLEKEIIMSDHYAIISQFKTI